MSDSAEQNPPLPDPDVFVRSPIVHREARFSFEITQEEFDQKAPSLIAQLEKEGLFSEKKVKELWKFELELRDGKAPKPKVTMIQIPELHRTNGMPLTLQLSPPNEDQPASLALIQSHNDTNPTRFAHLKSECEIWAPRVFDHFGIVDASQVALGYRNEITKQRYPELWVEEDTVLLGNMMRLYAAMPNPKDPIFSPGFLIDFTRHYNGLPDTTLRVRFNFEQREQGGPVASCSLIFGSGGRQLKEKGLKGAFSELAVGHEAIYAEFCCQFSEAAIDIFSK